MTAKRPAFQFYPADWRKEPSLRVCSLAARGLWIELMCVAHESASYGALYLNGKPMTVQQIANQVGGGVSSKEIAALLTELEDAGVYSKDESGAIYSRRMVRDEVVRNKRAKGGEAGKEHGIKGADHGSKGAVFGAKGGRPPSAKGGDNPPLQEPETPAPSSSSSSSTSENLPPLPPVAGGKSGREKSPSVTLPSWLEACKAKGEKPISDWAPLTEYAADAGLPQEFIALAWREFRDRHAISGKRYRDWRRTFLNAVRGNWFRLWFVGENGPALTSVGLQARAAQEAKQLRAAA